MAKLRELLVKTLGQALRIYVLRTSKDQDLVYFQCPNRNIRVLGSVKLNKAVKNESKELDINLKTLQTHKEFQAINFLQRNRNWADGLIFIPTSWARNNYTILET